MRSLLLTALLTGLLAVLFACGPTNTNTTTSTNTSTGPCSVATTGSPTEAYKNLYAAVKSKDTEKIKGVMTKKTQEFAQMVAARQNSPIEKVFENGFTATTFAESLPEIRDERVNCEYGAVEVWNAKDKRFEDIGFIYEDGGWKLAVGEMFAGSFKPPGPSRSFKEQEAANVLSNNMVPANIVNTNANLNSNVKIIIPKERPEPANK
jgi:hypothetical protein